MPRYISMLFPGGRCKTLTFSYDDGVEQDIRLVDIMKKNGLKGTFNLSGGLFAPEGYVFKEGRIHRELTEKKALEIYDPDFCEIATHGMFHENLKQCSSAMVFDSTVCCRRHLEKMFGRKIEGMAYPFGVTNDEVVETLRTCGIKYSRTTVSTLDFKMPTDWLRLNPTCHHKSAKLDELADKFLAMQARMGAPYMFYVWGHAYEFEMDNNWEIIENFAKKIGGHDDIWYATNGEIYDYVRDFHRLQSSVDGRIWYNPTARDLWFTDRVSKVYMVKAGETVCMEEEKPWLGLF